MTIPHCDHASVGILVFCRGRLLLIERRRKPLGWAPPAGHVDDHGGFEEAARGELLEEVGLTAGPLELVAEGYRDNCCRRPRGTWHYWKIYRTSASGEVRSARLEVRAHRWCSPGELAALAAKTRRQLGAGATDVEVRNDPGLEPVWCDWLSRIGYLGKDRA